MLFNQKRIQDWQLREMVTYLEPKEGKKKKKPKEGKLVTREFKKMKLAVQHGSVMEQVRDSGYQISKYNTDRRTAILR